MPISQALYTGITGLGVNSDGMAVVANNIANANAKGFKRDRAEFEDMLSTDLNSGSGSAQIGRGSRLGQVKTIHSQGGLAITGNLTDLAIEGAGFFVLANKTTEVQESAGRFYSRLGSFNFDKDGYLANNSGGRVQGYVVNEDGALSTRLTDIRLETNSIPPKATKTVTLNLNLDAREKMPEIEWNPEKPELTSNFSHTITVFDSHGTGHQMTVYYRRAEADEGIKWEWHAMVDGTDVTDSESAFKEISMGVASFDDTGNLLDEVIEFSEVNWQGGAKQGQRIELDFGRNILQEGGNGIGAATTIAASSVTNFHSQDGYEAGNIKSLKIDLDGSLKGIYTNGIVKELGALAMATFENQDGLMKAGRNQFIATVTSGPAKIGTPRTGTRGSIFASTLEESNVDLAQEFVNMILTQRGFQANSRSITTTDSMIEEIVNLKR